MFLILNAFCDISLLQWNSTGNSEKLTRILQYFKQQSLIWEVKFQETMEDFMVSRLTCKILRSKDALKVRSHLMHRNIVDAVASCEQGLKYVAVDCRDTVHTTYSKSCMTRVTFVVLLWRYLHDIIAK